MHTINLTEIKYNLQEIDLKATCYYFALFCPTVKAAFICTDVPNETQITRDLILIVRNNIIYKGNIKY